MLPSGRERELYESQITRALSHIKKYTPRQRLPCAWRHPGQFERLGNNPTQVFVAHALKQITCAAVVGFKAFIKWRKLRAQVVVVAAHRQNHREGLVLRSSKIEHQLYVCLAMFLGC